MMSMRLALYGGAGYFVLVTMAHAFGVKIPGLYVYFDVPSYAYQDKIIAFLAFGWAACFFIAAQSLSKSLIGALLVSGCVAIGMLVWINVGTDLWD